MRLVPIWFEARKVRTRDHRFIDACFEPRSRQTATHSTEIYPCPATGHVLLLPTAFCCFCDEIHAETGEKAEVGANGEGDERYESKCNTVALGAPLSDA